MNVYSLNLDEVMVGIKVCAAGKMSSLTVIQDLLVLAGPQTEKKCHS